MRHFLHSVAIGLLLGGALRAEEPAKLPEIERQAVALYEQGNFVEARPLLEQLDAAGAADGPLLYRLAFCLRQAQDGAAASTEQRAMERLERDVASARDLEIPFYLVNVYQNQGRKDQVRQVASATTERVKRGELPRPVTGLDQFRMAKLLADQGDEEGAVPYYRDAIESFRTDSGPSHPSYDRWANQFLATRALRTGDLAEAERRLAALAASEPRPRLEDLDKLAVLRVRLGRYADAAAAWQQIERQRPAEADRARYCAQLAQRAVSLGKLPERDGQDRPFKDMSQADLEAVMVAEVQAARDLQAQGQGLEAELRAEVEGRLGLAKSRFVAAALEYAARGLPIRETAFQGGYAVHVFQDSAWQIPPG